MGATASFLAATLLLSALALPAVPGRAGAQDLPAPELWFHVTAPDRSTRKGRIVIALDPALAPRAAAAVAAWVEEGAYLGAPVAGASAGNGAGMDRLLLIGPARAMRDAGAHPPDIAAEPSDAPVEKGAVGLMPGARPGSSGSRLFIALGPHPEMTGRVSVIGRVIGGEGAAEWLSRPSAAARSAVVGAAQVARCRRRDGFVLCPPDPAPAGPAPARRTGPPPGSPGLFNR